MKKYGLEVKEATDSAMNTGKLSGQTLNLTLLALFTEEMGQ